MMTSREFRRLVVAVSNGYAAADKRVDAGNREESAHLIEKTNAGASEVK